MHSIGLIGLAVMGENLVLNLVDNGETVSVYNRTEIKTRNFVSRTKNNSLIGTYSLKEFCDTLTRPRKIIMLVKAGKAVDEMVCSLLPLLEKGDLIVDGGNSSYLDTERLVDLCSGRGIYYIGCGISGGEKGARYGPAMMPGGDKRGWPLIEKTFKRIAAKTDKGPCCEWIGSGGSGHFVKMIHNGIEYGEMQLLSESYDLMKTLLGMTPGECADVFEEWLKAEHDSFLLKITVDILRKEKGLFLEKIRDVAYQKGTGRKCVEAAMAFGVPIDVISEAVFIRDLSVLKELRKKAEKELPKASVSQGLEKEKVLLFIRQGLYLARLIAYTQGFLLIKEAALKYSWKLDYKTIIQIWSNGCILRSDFIGHIGQAYERDPGLECLLFDVFFKQKISEKMDGWRKCVSLGIASGVPIAAFSVSLSFYDAFCTSKLTTNLIQAQRDYFGAHLYELEHNKGVFLHTNWTSSE